MARGALLIVLAVAACGGRVVSAGDPDAGAQNGSGYAGGGGAHLIGCPGGPLVVSGPPVLPGSCGTAPLCQVTTFEPCRGTQGVEQMWTVWSCKCSGTWACEYVNSGLFVCHPGGPGWPADAGGE